MDEDSKRFDSALEFWSKLNGQLSVQVAQNGVGFYNDGRLFWAIPIETGKALDKDLHEQLKLHGMI